MSERAFLHTIFLTFLFAKKKKKKKGRGCRNRGVMKLDLITFQKNLAKCTKRRTENRQTGSNMLRSAFLAEYGQETRV